MTTTLTLNLGLRFEDHTPLYEIDNRAVNFGLHTGTIYTATGVDGTAKFSNQALYNNYPGIGDWQPRIGFAWSPAHLAGKDGNPGRVRYIVVHGRRRQQRRTQL